MKRILIAATLVALLTPTLSSAAVTSSTSVHRAGLAVSRATARAEILRHYWLGRKPPQILWCVPKRYGTICMLRVPFHKSNKYGWVRGVELQCVWVSRTRGRVAAVMLWATFSAVVG